MWIDTEVRDKEICQLYASGKYTVFHLAKTYNLSPRSIQRIARAGGVIRTQAEANRVAAPLKNYYRLPEHLKARSRRKSLDNRIRYALIKEQPWCTTCGSRPEDGIKLEVDHIDNDPSNNELSNLQVLCGLCNRAKDHLNRFKFKALDDKDY